MKTEDVSKSQRRLNFLKNWIWS